VSAASQAALGLFPPLLGWTLLRRVARAGWSRVASTALDAAPVLLIWAALAGAMARPVTAGIVVGGMFAGLAFADHTKRAVLREPIVFSDMSELVPLFLHPRLYLPFASRGALIGGGAALLLCLAAVVALEPPVWGETWTPLALPGALIAAVLAVARPPILPRAAALLRRLGPTDDPAVDARALGPLAALLVHGVIARAERAPRRGRVLPRDAAPFVHGARDLLPTIVVVQSESFFDARRLHPGIDRGLLSSFDACCADGVSFGRLDVPGWGANTVRTEFAVLTGLAATELGFDRFNPYHAFARVPIDSMAWRLRARGYRTLCLHPFDRRFYRRDLVMPCLGFDAFLGIERFAGAARANGYVTDLALAQAIGEIAEAEGRGLFVFAISMENHGPWHGAAPAADLAPGLPRRNRYDPLRRYLAGLRGADAMLEALTARLARHGHPAVLALYGDHVPSLPECFDEFGLADPRTDYVLWHNLHGRGLRHDLAAHELQGVILAALDSERPRRHYGG
jgi:Sulfatase